VWVVYASVATEEESMYRVVQHEKMPRELGLAADVAWLMVSGALLVGVSTVFWLRRVLPW
jgi:hypothetical protein